MKEELKIFINEILHDRLFTKGSPWLAEDELMELEEIITKHHKPERSTNQASGDLR